MFPRISTARGYVSGVRIIQFGIIARFDPELSSTFVPRRRCCRHCSLPLGLGFGSVSTGVLGTYARPPFLFCILLRDSDMR